MGDDRPAGDDEREGQRLAVLGRIAVVIGVVNAGLTFAGVTAASVGAMVMERQNPGSGWAWAAWLLPLSAVPVTIGGYVIGLAAGSGVLLQRPRWWRELMSWRLWGSLAGVFVLIALSIGALQLAADRGLIAGPLGWIGGLVALDLLIRVARARWFGRSVRSVLPGFVLGTLFIAALFGGGWLLWEVFQPQTPGERLVLLLSELVLLGGIVVGRLVATPHWRGWRVLGPLYRGEYETALSRAEDLFPPGDGARALVHAIRLESGDVDGALSGFQAEFSDGEALSAYAASVLGWIELARGEQEAAEARFVEAGDEPGNLGASGVIRLALERGVVGPEVLELASKQVREASTPWVMQALGADGTAGPRALRAWVLAATGDVAGSRADIEAVRPLLRDGIPGHTAPAWFYLGRAEERLGERSAAASCYRAGSADPGRYGGICRDALANLA